MRLSAILLALSLLATIIWRWSMPGARRFAFHRGSIAGVGLALQQLASFYQPRAKHMIQFQLTEAADEDESCGSGSAEQAHRHLLRQARRIRKGTHVGPLRVLLTAAAVALNAPAGAQPAAAAPTSQTSTPSGSKAGSVDGTWLGTLDLGLRKLRIVFHLATTASGLSATLDSPDQNVAGIAVPSTTLKADQLILELPAMHANFTGTVAADVLSIAGKWTQGATSLPLLLTRPKDVAAATAARCRPQNPTRPFPYHEEDVGYPNAAQGNTLAATLTLPPGKGPFPAVLLITGSGAQDRDETLLGHKPFLVLSDFLTRRGIAVLRADDRGVGKSTGNFSAATTADFATDAEAGLAYLRGRPEIDLHHLGLIGHSEGAIIAPMVAARNPAVCFVVMLAGSGVPGAQIIAEQSRRIDLAEGLSPQAAQQTAEEDLALFRIVTSDPNPDTRGPKLRDALLADKVSPGEIDGKIAALTTPWQRFFLAYDPAPALRKLTIPMLVLAGSKDLQVPPEQNLGAIREALAADRDKHVEIVEFPNLNHLFQTAPGTGSPTEYEQIEETIAPEVLERIASWIVGLSPDQH